MTLDSVSERLAEPWWEPYCLAALQREPQQQSAAGMSDIFQKAFQKAFRESFERGILQGTQETITSLIKIRFGAMDAEMQAILPVLMKLPPDQYVALLLQSSREELLQRLSPGQ